ncbi:MAG: hypothetical protein AB8B52_02970 [Winogradskyella sp.]|uniref:hypothetical protein n=1 Tax=Winogradskyella sp. TaxID=1883156 RepID=UPI00385B9011
MKKFLINIIILGLILLALFLVLDQAITSGLRKSNMVIFDKITRLHAGSINADLIINGNSKSYLQLSPRIIDSVLNVNSYNLGIDGNDFVIQKLQYDLYEEKNTVPKIIIQTMDFASLRKAEGELYNYIRFAPYLGIDEVKETTKKYEGFSFIDYNLPLFKYSGKPLEVIDGIFSSVNVHIATSNLEKGYIQKDLTWDGSFDKFKETNKNGINSTIAKSTCDLFEEYIIECKRKNIDLFLVYTPVYHEFIPFDLDRQVLFDYLEAVSRKYDVPFLDYSEDELTFNKAYFFNSQHLNKKGSELFTEKLSVDIKTLLYNKDVK